MGLQWAAKRSLVAQIMGVSETEVFRFGQQLAYLNPRLESASRILAQTATPLTQVSWEWKILQTDLSATFALIADQATPALLGFTEAIDKLIKKLNDHPNAVAGATAGAFPGMTAIKIAGQGLGHLIGTDKMQAGMPSVSSWMKQLPASSWEKMGLVVGPYSSNYAKETAKNTRQMAKDLSTLAKFVVGNGGKLGNSPGAQWAMSMIGNAP
jgi:hypothetical protein